MIQCGTPAGAGPLSPRHCPLTSPPSHPDGSSPPAGRGHTSCLPRAAHLTHSPPSSGPLVAHSPWGARWYLPEGTREARLAAGDETRLPETPGVRRALGSLTVLCRQLPAPAAAPPPFGARGALAGGGRAGARSPSNVKTRSRSNWPKGDGQPARSGGASGFGLGSGRGLRGFL